MGSKIVNFTLAIATHALTHLFGAGTANVIQAAQDVEKVLALSPGQQANIQIGNVNEHGSTYEIWIVVNRTSAQQQQQAAPTNAQLSSRPTLMRM